MFSQVSNFLFLHFVESPHMRKIYGDKVRKDAGVVKTVKAATILPQKVKDEVSRIREKLGEAAVLERTRVVSGKAHELVEGTTELVHSVAPKIQGMVSSSKALLENSREKLFVARTWDDMGVYDMTQYSVKIVSEKSPRLNADGIPTFELGERITVEWTAPLNHGAKDWIGIYKISSNSSYKATNVASKGRYLFVGKDAQLGEAEEGVDDHAGKGDGDVIEEEVVWVNEQELCRGKVVFWGDKLPWFHGTFEFRYHHHDRYNVMAYTPPFEITLESHEAANLSITSIGQTLLPYVQRCFNLDDDTMPCSVEEQFIMINEVIAQRIVKGIQLFYGIEFTWEVVAIDMSCMHLAMRILTAVRALAPFSTLSSSAAGAPQLIPVSPTLVVKQANLSTL
ncbi:phosphatidylethanolamine N-methyltransferase [Mortierella sp. AM989]|nr:phosphatidylethanolamine N-methyltransferase [Mortierella sp. AM989]